MKIKKRRLMITLFITVLALCVPLCIYAADKGTYNALYTLRINNLDSIGNFGLDIIRMVGWKVITGLANLVDGFYKAMNDIFQLMTFSTSGKIIKLVGNYKLIYKAILTATIVIIGLWLIIGNKIENQLNVSTCLMLMLVVLLGMPVITEKMNDLTMQTSKYAMSQWNPDAKSKGLIDSISSGLIYDQIVDLNVLDASMNAKTGSMPRFSKYGNGSNDFKPGSQEWKYININEGMGDEDNNSLVNPGVWKHKLQYQVNKDEKLNIISTTDKFFIKEYYYRYQVRNWGLMFLELLAIVVVLSFTLIRIVRLIIEITMAQIYMPVIAITDVASGQRIKEAIKGFIILFASIFLIYAILGIFFLGMVFINSLNVSGILKFVFILGLSWALIDGSDILERVLGVDLGLKSSTWLLAGAYTTAKAAGKTAGLAGRIFKNRPGNHKMPKNDDVNKGKKNDKMPSNDTNINTDNKEGITNNDMPSNTNQSENNINNKNNTSNNDMPSNNIKNDEKNNINNKDIDRMKNDTNSQINNNSKSNKDLPSNRSKDSTNKDLPSNRKNINDNNKFNKPSNLKKDKVPTNTTNPNLNKNSNDTKSNVKNNNVKNNNVTNKPVKNNNNNTENHNFNEKKSNKNRKDDK